MKRTLVISALIVTGFSQVFAQNSLQERETVLAGLLSNLRNAKNDQEKAAANKSFKEEMRKTIALPGAFSYPFEQLSTVGMVASPDSSFRFFNWNIEQDDFTQKYECFILHYNDRHEEYDIIELKDNSMMLPPRPDDILEADNWYGALYYQIIPFEKGNRQMYTVLGWDGNDQSSNIKLIDVLYFTGTSVRLGNPVFRMNDQTLKRVFFEHSENAVMSLRYEEKYDRIIFDHLSPESPGMEGFYSYYVPDMSYDALVLKRNRWTLQEDVIGINEHKSEKMTISVIDEKTGEPKEIRVKDKWQDPTDESAPAGGSVHVAVKPEADGSSGSKKNKPVKQKKKNRKYRNTPKSNTGL